MANKVPQRSNHPSDFKKPNVPDVSTTPNTNSDHNVLDALQHRNVLSLSDSESSSKLSDFLFDDGDITNYYDELQPSLSSDEDEEHQIQCIQTLEDWDLGLRNTSEEWQDDKNQSWTIGAAIPEMGWDFPRRTFRFLTCQICFETCYLRTRVCCEFPICPGCLSMYIDGKVKVGKVQIECPSDRCNGLIRREEVRYCLSVEMREKYNKFLIDANKDPYIKTCPSCSLPYEIDPAKLKGGKKKLKYGVEVKCSQCRLYWCFLCQAPFHTNVSCKKYKNEIEMLKRWAEEKTRGQQNAQQCPKCKIFVQRIDGCDYMDCSNCGTHFCYRCGDRFIKVNFLGGHKDAMSVFGCTDRYTFLSKKPWFRRSVRGSLFAGRIMVLVLLAGVGVAAGAALVASSVVILPGYGIFHLTRRGWASRKRKKYIKRKQKMAEAQMRSTPIKEKLNGIGNLETVVEESETEASEPVADSHQVQVIVHHPEGMDEGTGESKDCDIICNRYTGEETPPTLLANESSSPVGDGTEAPRGESHAEVVGKASYPREACERKDERGFDEQDVYNDKSGDGDDRPGKVKNCSADEISDESDTDGELNNSCNVSEEHTHVASSDSPPQELCEIVNSNLSKINLGVSENENTQMSQPSEQDDVEGVDAEQKLLKANGKIHHNENLIKSKDMKEGEKDPATEKIDRETEKIDREAGGRGCFGNIFSVGKWSVGVNNSNSTNQSETDDSVLKLDKSSKQILTHLPPLRKAATWEKCRRLEMGPWIKSSLDSSNDKTNANHSFVKFKSPSSLSSILSFNFGADDEFDKNKDKRVDRDLPQQGDINLNINMETSDTTNAVGEPEINVAEKIELETEDEKDSNVIVIDGEMVNLRQQAVDDSEGGGGSRIPVPFQHECITPVSIETL